jgi:hypothetical protein
MMEKPDPFSGISWGKKYLFLVTRSTVGLYTILNLNPQSEQSLYFLSTVTSKDCQEEPEWAQT